MKMMKSTLRGNETISLLTETISRSTEQFVLENAFSPLYHRIDQAVRWRAAHPDDEVKPPADIIVKYSRPPDALQGPCKEAVAKLIEAANVKKGTLSISLKGYKLMCD